MKKHDLIIIGAGPGGYVAAIRAAQLGLDVGIIEKEEALGGTCLRVGCIPSKALLESSERYRELDNALPEHGISVGGASFDLGVMLERKRKIVDQLTKGVASLMKKNGVTRYRGLGVLKGSGRVAVEPVEGEGVSEEIEAQHILIATGSRTASLPGVELDGEYIGTSTDALSYGKVPEHLVVIGAGYIGLELGSVWLRLGARVTVLEYLDRILPGVDAELAREAQKLFKRQGFEFHLESRVSGARVEKGMCVVEREGGDPIECDRVLVATGRVPNTDGLNLDTAGIEPDNRGFIPVDDNFETEADGVYAIGDVIRGPMLAHKAEEEGIACVEKIVTGFGHVTYDAIPGIVYTQPEIASVGKNEEELKETGIRFNRGVFQFRGNGRARSLGQVDGRIKILADRDTDRILGVHIIGPRAGDLIAEAAVAIEFGASSEDLARTCHAHPTLSEALREAALAVGGRAIHA